MWSTCLALLMARPCSLRPEEAEGKVSLSERKDISQQIHCFEGECFLCNGWSWCWCPWQQRPSLPHQTAVPQKVSGVSVTRKTVVSSVAIPTSSSFMNKDIIKAVINVFINIMGVSERGLINFLHFLPHLSQSRISFEHHNVIISHSIFVPFLSKQHFCLIIILAKLNISTSVSMTMCIRFVREDSAAISYSCLSSCVYERDDQPGTAFCFAQGDQQVTFVCLLHLSACLFVCVLFCSICLFVCLYVCCICLLV